MFTLYPGMSLVRNIGHDGLGTHSDRTDVFNVQLAAKMVPVTRIKIIEDGLAREAFKKFLRDTNARDFFSRVMRKLRRKKPL